MGSWNLSLSTTAWTLQGPESRAVISLKKLAWKMKRRMPEPGVGGKNRGEVKLGKISDNKPAQLQQMHLYVTGANRLHLQKHNQVNKANKLWTGAWLLPSGWGWDLKPNSREKSGPSQSLWQARGKTASSRTRRDSKYARMVSSATLDRLGQKRSPGWIWTCSQTKQKCLDFSPHESIVRHSHVDVILDEVTHNKIVAELGKVHGCVLVFGRDVAVSPILQQEAHYISVPSFASLMEKSHSNLKEELIDWLLQQYIEL